MPGTSRVSTGGISRPMSKRPRSGERRRRSVPQNGCSRNKREIKESCPKMARLLSVNVGLPRDVTWNGKTVRTAVWKSPVTGRRMVRKLDIDGDAQTDRESEPFRASHRRTSRTTEEPIARVVVCHREQKVPGAAICRTKDPGTGRAPAAEA